MGSGVTPKGGSENYPDEGIKFIRSQNVHFDGLRLDDVVYIYESTYLEMQNSKVEKYDVLLNITGASIGRCCIVEIDEPLNVNQHVCIIRTKKSLSPYFLNYFLKSSVGQEQIAFYTTGANREGLSLEGVKSISLSLPEIIEQQQIVDYLDTQTALIDQNISLELQKIEKLKEYRQSLISNVVTGKICVLED